MAITKNSKLKHCPKCCKKRKRKNFYPNTARHDGLAVYCKFCHAKYNSEKGYSKNQNAINRANAWKKRNPDRYKAAQLRSFLKRRGDEKSYEDILRDMTSGLRCPYCQELIESATLSYDHNESGLLACCMGCNLVKHVFSYEDFMKIVSLLGIQRIKEYHGRVRHGKTS